MEQPILDFLNAGGTRKAVIDYLYPTGRFGEKYLLERDLTKDGVPELLVGEGNLRVYTCKDGQYYTAMNLEPIWFDSPYPLTIQDMNLDGLPEILVARWDEVSVGRENYYQILGWDGKQFKNLIAQPDTGYGCYVYADRCQEDGWIASGGHAGIINAPPHWEVGDIDQNGTEEFTINDGIGHSYDAQYNGPWRVHTTIYMWNGKGFVIYSDTHEPPRYRFQALQDGDKAVLKGRYDEALELYQAVIFSDQLEWWSTERQAYEFDLNVMTLYGTPAPTQPAPDPAEYPSLAAYARYRIMLLHISRGWLPEAQVVYDTLQEKFPAGQPGHAYAELASAFWSEYQVSQTIRRACANTVEYASKHQQGILYYIGDYHHGWQAIKYIPEDVCPFK